MGACGSKQPLDYTEQEVNFNQFKILRSIGKGAFGKVCIVKKRDTKQLYAMKYMNKEKCVQAKAVKNVCNERKILEMLNHKLLVNMWFAFQDEEDMFMVIDLMLGGDLGFHLQRTGAFSEKRVWGYVAEISSALEYLHNKVGIVHRDIKPDNILLDDMGHAHLTDFNVSAFLKPNNDKIMSRAGTRPYFAPEMISKQGYRQGCDWWSLGATMIEMLTAKNPFRADRTSDIAERICREPIPWPENVSEDCLSFLKGLLERDPNKRLGGPKRFDELKAHPWFKDLNWHGVGELEIAPEFVPDKDKVHCDAMHELEEMMLEDKPLSQKKNRIKKLQNQPTPEPCTKEYELFQIHDQYKMFDRLKAEKLERIQISQSQFNKDNSEFSDNDSNAGEQSIRDTGSNDAAAPSKDLKENVKEDGMADEKKEEKIEEPGESNAQKKKEDPGESNPEE